MFRVSCFVFRVSCFVFRVSCLVFRVSCFVFRVSCFVFRVSNGSISENSKLFPSCIFNQPNFKNTLSKATESPSFLRILHKLVQNSSIKKTFLRH